MTSRIVILASELQSIDPTILVFVDPQINFLLLCCFYFFLAL